VDDDDAGTNRLARGGAGGGARGHRIRRREQSETGWEVVSKLVEAAQGPTD
jgi:hypothetical protein